jgi:sec-independent protein translocase protein TatA
MHMPSIWGLLIVLVLAFLLFGKPGRLSGMMEDVGKGIKGFRKGLSDADKGDATKSEDPPKRITDQTASPTQSSSEQTKSGT